MKVRSPITSGDKGLRGASGSFAGPKKAQKFMSNPKGRTVGSEGIPSMGSPKKGGDPFKTTAKASGVIRKPGGGSGKAPLD